MAKRISELESFFIDNHSEMNDAELARVTGLSINQVQRRKKLNREGNPVGTPEKRLPPNPGKPDLVAASQAAANNTPDVPTRPSPAMRIDSLIGREKDGTTCMTGAASELSDLFDGIGPDSKGPVVPAYNPFADESRVHKIKKDA